MCLVNCAHAPQIELIRDSYEETKARKKMNLRGVSRLLGVNFSLESDIIFEKDMNGFRLGLEIEIVLRLFGNCIGID